MLFIYYTLPNEALNFPLGDDPVGENPFAVSEQKHRFWEGATREAEESVHALNSDCLKNWLLIKPRSVCAGLHRGEVQCLGQTGLRRHLEL